LIWTTKRVPLNDPAVSLSIYSDAQLDDLRAAGVAMFG